MNLDELRSAQTRERQKDELQHLQDDFYQRVGDYIADLKEQRERAAERADSPFDSSEVQQLTDEINTAEEVAESIYERRMGKVLESASLSASGYSTDTDGLTTEEQALFEDLVDRITDNKQAVLDVLAGTEDDNSSEPERTEDTADTAVDSAPIMESNESPPSTEATTDGGQTTVQPSSQPATDPPAPETNSSADSVDERITVHVLEDVGDILGVDERQYDLASDDVVSLPATNAQPLIQQNIAEPVDTDIPSTPE